MEYYELFYVVHKQTGRITWYPRQPRYDVRQTRGLVCLIICQVWAGVEGCVRMTSVGENTDSHTQMLALQFGYHGYHVIPEDT